MVKLQGIFAPLPSPFDHNGDLWKAKVQHNAGKWNLTGLTGYVVCGCAGEGTLLSAEEKIRLWEWVAESASPEKLLIAAAGVDGVRETVALANRAAEAGYHAALVRAPRFPGVQAIYFRAVADQSRIPIVMSAACDESGIEAAAELSQHPNIVAALDFSGSAVGVRSTLTAAKPGFQMLAGAVPALALSLQAGAAGAILAFASAAPYAAISVWEAHRTRENEAALEWQDRIAPAARLVASKYGVPGLKYALDLGGYYGGPPRLPLTAPSPDAKREIEAAFADLRG